MNRYAVAAAVGQVVFAAALGGAVGLVVAVVYTVANAVASIGSPAAQPAGGVVLLFVVAAMLYGAAAGVLVGLAGAALLPDRAHLARWRRWSFVVLACATAAAATAALGLLIDVPLVLLVVPAVLFVPALAAYLRRYAPR